MSWRGDRYKLNDHGQEQAANQRAYYENGEIVVAEIPERVEEVGCSRLKLAALPLSRLLKKKRLRSGKR